MNYDLNWLAIIVSVIAYQLIGFLWYGPIFGKMWLQASGRTREEMGGGASAAYAVSIAASLASALVLALFLANAAEEPDLVRGIKYGVLAGIGFAAASILTGAAFDQRNPTVTWLFVAYQIVALGVMGAILGAWR